MKVHIDHKSGTITFLLILFTMIVPPLGFSFFASVLLPSNFLELPSNFMDLLQLSIRAWWLILGIILLSVGSVVVFILTFEKIQDLLDKTRTKNEA